MKQTFFAALAVLVLGSCGKEYSSTTFQRENNGNGFRLYHLHHTKYSLAPDTSYSVEYSFKDSSIMAIRRTAPDSEDYFFYSDDTLGKHAHIVSTKKGRLSLALYPDGAYDTMYLNGCPFKVLYGDSLHYRYNGLLTPCNAEHVAEAERFIKEIDWYWRWGDAELRHGGQQVPGKF